MACVRRALAHGPRPHLIYDQQDMAATLAVLIEQESRIVMDNTTTLVGNAARDPELRTTGSGQPVASFGLAVNRRWLNKATNQYDEQVSFFDVTAWGDLAKNVGESVHKGDRVIVTGRLEQQTWEQDGNKRSKVQVVADEVGPSLRWATANVSRNPKDGQSAGYAKAGAAQPSGGYGGYNAQEEPFRSSPAALRELGWAPRRTLA